MLDAFLLFFDVLSILSWIKFYKARNQPFSARWWGWLTMTGASLALTTSVKLVGMFVIGLVGCATVHDLWRLMDFQRGLNLVSLN